MLRSYFFFPDFFFAFFFGTVPHLRSLVGCIESRADARAANFRVFLRAELIDALHLCSQQRDSRRAAALQLSFSNSSREQRKHENNLFATSCRRTKSLRRDKFASGAIQKLEIINNLDPFQSR
jgi:hypothetical protein